MEETLSIPEAAEFIKQQLNSNLPKKYWLRFIANHARPKNPDNPFVWCQMELTREGYRGRVKKESIDRFLEEAVNHEFPLKSINEGYKRNDIIKRNPVQKIEKKQQDELDRLTIERDNIAKQAIVTVLSSQPKTEKEKSIAFDMISSIVRLWSIRN